MYHFNLFLIAITCFLATACGDSEVIIGTYSYSNAEQNAVLEVSGDGTFRQEFVRLSDRAKSSLLGKWKQKGLQITFHPFLMPLNVDTGKPLALPLEFDTVDGEVFQDIISINPDDGYNYHHK
jgi:hypothetical protein